MASGRHGRGSHTKGTALPTFRQTARFFFRFLLGLDLAFLALCLLHSIFDYFSGGWPSVEGWYVHLQIEGQALGSAGWRHHWTWLEALRPELIYAAAAPVLWAAARFLRPAEIEPES